MVAGKADAVDVNHIRVGQTVSITSDAFPGAPIGGQVISVSAPRPTKIKTRAFRPSTSGPRFPATRPHGIRSFASACRPA
ncbi:hypothetical protein [Bradyrhizobium sp. WD16]|uniref:hypothetical protein n=1 Tax=Bradyrhizobium sp. WD16 TaxID=1521768 RepID=UPI003531C955